VAIRDSVPQSPREQPVYDEGRLRELGVNGTAVGNPAEESKQLHNEEYSVSGIVVDDETSLPVSNARVLVHRNSGDGVTEPRALLGQHSEYTNEVGEFTIPSGEEPAPISIRHHEYAPYFGEAWPHDAKSDDTETVEYRLKRGGLITGTVTAEGYGPLPNATVLAMGRGFDAHKLPNEQDLELGYEVEGGVGRTDQEGRFAIGGLRSGCQYLIRAGVPGMIEKSFLRKRVAQTGDDVAIVLRPAAVINFQLADKPTGHLIRHAQSLLVLPGPDASVRMDSPDWLASEYWFGSESVAEMGRLDGTFFAVVPLHEWPIPDEASVRVKARAYGYSPIDTLLPLQVPWSRTSLHQHKIMMTRAGDSGQVSATFLDRNDSPLSDINITLTLQNKTGSPVVRIRGVPDRNGELVFTLPVGEYSEARIEGWEQCWDGMFSTVVPDSTVEWELRLELSYVRMNVRDEQGLDAFDRTDVRCAHALGRGPVEERTVGRRIFGQRWPLRHEEGLPRGTAQLGPFREGERTFEVEAEGYRSTSLTQVVPKGVVVDIEVVLR
jgi:hypothetical protein